MKQPLLITCFFDLVLVHGHHHGQFGKWAAIRQSATVEKHFYIEQRYGYYKAVAANGRKLNLFTAIVQTGLKYAIACRACTVL